MRQALTAVKIARPNLSYKTTTTCPVGIETKTLPERVHSMTVGMPEGLRWRARLLYMLELLQYPPMLLANWLQQQSHTQ